MREIKISVWALLGILLFIIGVLILGIATYSYSNGECIRDPVAYANNHSKDYGWDWVTPIYIGPYG